MDKAQHTSNGDSEYDEDRIAALVGQRMAPVIALRHLEPLFAEWEYVLRDFLGELPGPDLDGGPLTLLEVTISGDGTLFEIRTAGPTNHMISASAEVFEKLGADPQALDDLARIGGGHQPDELGIWLSLRVGNANCGWFVPGANLALAEETLLSPAQVASLDDWASETSVDIFAAAGRSVAPGDALAFVDASLPGDAVQQVERALAIFNAFEAQKPVDDLLAPFMYEEHNGLDASLWLLKDGVARSGIRAVAPSLGLVITLAQTLGAQDLDLIAQIQGILQSPYPKGVEVQQRGDDTMLLVSFDLLVSAHV